MVAKVLFGTMVRPGLDFVRTCHVGPNHVNWKGGRSRTPKGYILLKGINQDTTYSTTKKGSIMEHVYVMSKHLGRKLYKDETVHHKNGIKDDNRLRNLELWSTNHPAGQRVSDLKKWAKTILKRYPS